MYTQRDEQQTIKHCIKPTWYGRMVPQSNKLLSLYVEDFAILIFYDVSKKNQFNDQQGTSYKRGSKNSVEEKILCFKSRKIQIQ